MRFEKYGKVKNNLRIEIRPLEHADYSVFLELNVLLEYIKQNKSEIYDVFVEKLQLKLQKLAQIELFKNKDKEIVELTKSYDSLKKQQELVKLHLNLFLQKLAISEDILWENKLQSFADTNFFQSANILFLYHLKTLIDILGRQEAFELYKGHIDNYIATYDTNQMGIYTNLDEMREKYIRFIDTGRFGRIRIISTVENGSFIILCENCEKAAALEELYRDEDRDIFNLTLCYCHFQLAKMWNEKFVLTQEQTIAKGDPYCEYVYHDTRTNKALTHPPKEFFDNIWQLNKDKIYDKR